MLPTQVLEFETNPCQNRYGELAGMRIRVELGNDSNLIITGTSTGAYEGKSYMGVLTLKKTSGGVMPYSPEGGDECWVNGVWVSPCPSAEEEP